MDFCIHRCLSETFRMGAPQWKKAFNSLLHKIINLWRLMLVVLSGHPANIVGGYCVREFLGPELLSIIIREAPPKLSPDSNGHCPNSDCTPRFRQPGTLGHFIFGPNWATLSNHCVDGYKCPKPSWQAFWTPPQSSNYPFELQFSLHKCPKPSWQAFWPPYNQANCLFGLGHLRFDPVPLNPFHDACCTFHFSRCFSAMQKWESGWGWM